MVSYVTDYNSEVRQAAIYGCGVLGMCGGPNFAGVCAEIMPFLLQVINSPDSRSTDNISATENAVSAIAKILEFNSSAVNVDEILPHWYGYIIMLSFLFEIILNIIFSGCVIYQCVKTQMKLHLYMVTYANLLKITIPWYWDLTILIFLV